ncbi:MAG: helix-turn-helix domain-containing protein [Proteobacteria bacterium]|nr:helix-turn-helix domain-containing protein [Pseudomonadota bacterium]
MEKFGSKIKAFRTDRGLTLKQVADVAGCSTGYISQIEHEKVSPSIATLKRIAQALGVRIVDFFLDEANQEPVVAAPEDWRKVSLSRWQANIKQMVRSVSHRRMQPFHTTISPGGGSEGDYSHEGEEFGIVLQGTLKLTVGGGDLRGQGGVQFLLFVVDSPLVGQ